LVIKYSFGQSREIRSAELCKRGNYWFCGQQLSDLIRKFEDKYRFVKSKLLFLFLIYVALGCKKDNYQSKPELKLKEMRIFQSSQPKGKIIELDIEATDKEGDVADIIGIQKIYAFKDSCEDESYSAISIDTSYPIPDFPIGNNTQKVLFKIKLATINLNGHILLSTLGCIVPRKADTSFFKIWARDLAGNLSDTLITDNIIFSGN
jgi:hypothetical protein